MNLLGFTCETEKRPQLTAELFYCLDKNRTCLCRQIPGPSTMNVYIDESGIFANPNDSDAALSCVAALVIPDLYQEPVLSEYAKLSKSWRGDLDELKGKNLNEQQIDAIGRLLRRYHCFVEIAFIDMAPHSDEDIARHKKDQAGKFVEALSPEHHDSFREDVYDVKERLEELSNPLYVQAQVTTAVVANLLRHGVMYFANTIPDELGKFRWVIDAKGNSATPYEKLWRKIVAPLVQSHSLQSPVIVSNELGDFSHLEKFAFPDWPPQHLADKVHPESGGYDVRAILTQVVSFSDSKSNLGVQLADIVANGFRRAVAGNLRRSGWLNLGPLLIRRKGNAIRPIAMYIDDDALASSPSYYKHIRALNQAARPMPLRRNAIQSN